MFARINLQLGALGVCTTIFAAARPEAAAQATRATATLFETAKLPRLQVTEDLRLDGNAEDFSPMRSPAVSRRGAIAVPLTKDLQVRIYDSTGKKIGAIGRNGAGPGEFRGIYSVSWLADTLVITDITLRRISYVGPGAKFVRSSAIPSATQTKVDTTVSRFMPYVAHNNGTMVGEGILAVGPEHNGVRVMMTMNAAAGSYRVITDRFLDAESRWHMSLDDYHYDVPFALQPDMHWSSDGTRLVTLTGDQRTANGTFNVVVRDSRSRVAYDRTFTFRGVPIPSATVDSALDARFPLKAAPDRKGPTAAQWRDLAKKRMPAVFSPVERIIMGNDGRAWITLRANASGQEIVVLDERGTPSAVAKLPKGVQGLWVLQASSSQIWTTQTDEDGISSIVRYRISK